MHMGTELSEAPSPKTDLVLRTKLVCPPIHLSIHMSVRLSLCLSIHQLFIQVPQPLPSLYPPSGPLHV